VREDTIVLRLGSDPGTEGWLRPLAGLQLWCDHPVGGDEARAPATACAALLPRLPLTAVYDGPGLVGGRIERIRSFISADGARRVDFEDGESFVIAAGGDCIERIGEIGPCRGRVGPDRPEAAARPHPAAERPLRLGDLVGAHPFEIIVSGIVLPHMVEAQQPIIAGPVEIGRLDRRPIFPDTFAAGHRAQLGRAFNLAVHPGIPGRQTRLPRFSNLTI
jgi:hypothetical protein